MNSFHLENGDDASKAKWMPIAADRVPMRNKAPTTEMQGRPVEKVEEAYTTARQVRFKQYMKKATFFRAVSSGPFKAACCQAAGTTW